LPDILADKKLLIVRNLSCEFAATIAAVFSEHITTSISGIFSANTAGDITAKLIFTAQLP
jgi:hypothetical protein